MEENLDKNNEANKEISDNTIKSNSEEIKPSKMWKMIFHLTIMRKKWNQTLRCRHKGILEKLNQQFLLITE